MNEKLKSVIKNGDFNIFKKAIYHKVPDSDKALKVFNSLRKKMGLDTFDLLMDNDDIIEDYGCYMVTFNIPNWDDLLDNIDSEDIYKEEDEDFGLEYFCHVTILYGFHDETDLNKLKKLTLDFLDGREYIEITLTGISVFEGKEYDVLKFDVESEDLRILNKICKVEFKYTTEYEDYKPHMTLAYLKPNTSEKYLDSFKFNGPVKLKSGNFVYSDKNNKINKISLDEREIKFMAGSEAVEVKDECKLGGLPDGTSKQCNQGDINVLKLTKLK